MAQTLANKTSSQQKLVALCSYKALASFIYVIIKSLRDPLIATARAGAAESLAFVKGFIVVPASIGFVFVYGFLVNRYAPRKIFYSILSCFIGYFLIYALLLFPNAEALSPTGHFKSLVARFPNQKYIWAAYLNWVHVTFFVMSEFWAQIIIVLLFFSLVNELYQFKSAKKKYHLIIAGGYFGGLFGTFYMDLVDYLYGKKSADSVPTLLLTAVIMAMVLLVFYHWLDKNFLQQKGLQVNQKLKQEERQSLWESIRYITTHRRLLAIAMLVFGANLIPQFMEGIYNANLKAYRSEFAANWNFGRRVLQISIICSILVGFFLSHNIINRWGWKTTAYIMPVTTLVSGTLFLIGSAYQNQLGGIARFFHCSPRQFIVYCGAGQHLLWKVTEYVFFDKTRELAYLNCDVNAKRKGKAAIDLLGSRGGKALGNQALVLIACLAGVSSVLSVTWPIFLCMVLTCIPWCYSIHHLGNVVAIKYKTDQSDPQAPAAPAQTTD